MDIYKLKSKGNEAQPVWIEIPPLELMVLSGVLRKLVVANRAGNADRVTPLNQAVMSELTTRVANEAYTNTTLRLYGTGIPEAVRIIKAAVQLGSGVPAGLKTPTQHTLDEPVEVKAFRMIHSSAVEISLPPEVSPPSTAGEAAPN